MASILLFSAKCPMSSCQVNWRKFFTKMRFMVCSHLTYTFASTSTFASTLCYSYGEANVDREWV